MVDTGNRQSRTRQRLSETEPTVPQPLATEPEYALLLDAIAPLGPPWPELNNGSGPDPQPRPRTDHRAWDSGRWGRLLDIADWHRLSPVLFTHLRAVGGAPAPVLSALERAYLANAARSMFIRATTATVVRALDAAGVPSLLLKGAALVETVYDDPAEREMPDIDLLVPADRLGDATATLAELDYAPAPDPDADQHPIPGPTAVRIAPHQPIHDAALVGPEQLVAVELHRHIAIGGEEGGDFDLGGLWDRARQVPATDHRVPSPEDLLIHICFHFTRNRLGGSAGRRNTGGALAQILDIQRVVANDAVDWDELTHTARDFGLGTRVFLGLFAARELGVPIPAEAIEPIRPSGFDPQLGRRLVALRVLRAGDHLPVRSMRWMVAPSKEALRRGWNADSNATLSLARAYMRRARAHVPEARSAMRRPWVYVQDRRLNTQIEALRERA